MRRRRLSALLLSMITAMAGGAVAASPAVAGTDPPEAPPAGKATTVTLITGDRVTVTAGGGTSVRPGPGRAGMRFVSTGATGDRSVIPADALPLLRAGRLDARLFEVTALAEAGYTDELPLLIAHPGAANRARAAATVPGARVTRDLSELDLLAVRADGAGRAELWRSLTTGTSARALKPGIERVWLDGRRTISLDHSVPQIGAPAAWQAGLDGSGVKVAVLDTGIDATHPDLAGQIAESQNFTTAADADDEVGHGTHVASTIAGTGAASGGRYKGVAPGADLVIGKVCETDFCEESAILAGMTWAASRAPVVNMSLGGGDTPEIDPLEAAVGELTAQHGTLFVVAAGNAGGYATVGSPASADAALAVGAVDRDDQIAPFSSRGPRVGDNAIKPEITAPGVEIVAAKAAGDQIGGPAPVAGYASLSGTSMATPHVAGAAAILTQQHPGWTPQQRKTVLMGASKPTEGAAVYEQGAGRVDVARAITQQVAVQEGTVSFPTALWPHGDDQPVTETVTYRNDGASAVTLALSLTGPPVFTLGAAEVTVPAGGTATTTITADTSGAALTDGFLGGRLTATGPGGIKVEAPVGVYREPESYDVPVEVLDRAGAPAQSAWTVFFDLDTQRSFDITGPGGVQRLPKGEYGVFSFVESEAGTDTTFLVQPRLVIDDADPVRLDGRRARIVDITVPRRGAVNPFLAANADWIFDEFGFGASVGGDETYPIYTANLGGSADPSFTGSINASFFVPGPDGTALDSRTTYDLGWFREGSMYTGFRKAVQQRELATIKATYRTEAAGARGAKGNSARHGTAGYWTVLTPFEPPFRRTEFVNTDGGAQWSGDFVQELPPADEESFPETLSWSWSAPETLRAGRTYEQVWNKAVFAPAVAAPEWPEGYAFRIGDTVVAQVPTHGEGNGHPGGSALSEARVALYRGDTLIGESAENWGAFEVPAGAADYRLELSGTRGAPHTLSTEVSASWTFRSGHVPDDEARRLPLSTVRFDPALDVRNTAPAGRTVRVPVHIDQQVSAPIRAVTVDASFDDGRTWRAVPVQGTGAHRTAVIRHPGGKGFVSLRASVRTGAGTVSQRVIRAYAIG